ncbi:hypothetical protein ACFYP8_38755, partial [Streptomyces hirsutus]
IRACLSRVLGQRARTVLRGRGRSNASPLPDQGAKNECGLDEYEVRRCTGWCRHITLSTLAHALSAGDEAKGLQKRIGPVPLTVAETRLLDSLLPTHEPTTTPSPTH